MSRLWLSLDVGPRGEAPGPRDRRPGDKHMQALCEYRPCVTETVVPSTVKTALPVSPPHSAPREHGS